MFSNLPPQRGGLLYLVTLSQATISWSPCPQMAKRILGHPILAVTLLIGMIHIYIIVPKRVRGLFNRSAGEATVLSH